jgi:hypothetical protein
MKGWHLGGIVLLIIAYLIGVKYPSVGQSALSKVGLS